MAEEPSSLEPHLTHLVGAVRTFTARHTELMTKAAAQLTPEESAELERLETVREALVESVLSALKNYVENIDKVVQPPMDQ